MCVHERDTVEQERGTGVCCKLEVNKVFSVSIFLLIGTLFNLLFNSGKRHYKEKKIKYITCFHQLRLHYPSTCWPIQYGRNPATVSLSIFQTIHFWLYAGACNLLIRDLAIKDSVFVSLSAKPLTSICLLCQAFYIILYCAFVWLRVYLLLWQSVYRLNDPCLLTIFDSA